MVCDFCSGGSIVWRYPCNSFVMDEVVESIGDWAACMNCHCFINTNNYDDLASFAVTSMILRNEIAIEHAQTFYEYLRRLHGMFLANRTGACVRHCAAA